MIGEGGGRATRSDAGAAFECEPYVVTALGGDLGLAGLVVPTDQAQLVEDGGERVALVPAGQSLDAALGEQTAKIGMTKIGAVEKACIWSSDTRSVTDLTSGSRR